jgi:hypothetical protein
VGVELGVVHCGELVGWALVSWSVDR